MALVVYDQGVRIETPVSSLFRERNVDAATSGSGNAGLPSGEDIAQSQARLARQNAEHAFDDTLREQVDDRSAANERKAVNLYNQTRKESPEDFPKQLEARQVMASPVHTISFDASTEEAWQQMERLEIEHLVVIDGEENPIGVVSVRDVLNHGTHSVMPVAQIYRRKMLVAHPETEVSLLATTFVNYPVNAILVMEDDQLQGIVTRTDLLRLLINNAHVENWA